MLKRLSEKTILTAFTIIIVIAYIAFLFKPVSRDAGAFLAIASGILNRKGVNKRE